MRPVETGQLRRWMLPHESLAGAFVIVGEDLDGTRIYGTTCWWVLHDDCVASWTERALLNQSEVLDETG